MAGYPLPRSLGFLDALPAFQTSLCHSDPPSAAANTSGTEADSQSSVSNWPRICRMSSSSSVVHHHHQFVKLFSGWTENAGARTSKPLTLAMPDKLHRAVLGIRWAERPSSGVALAQCSREQPHRAPGTRVPFSQWSTEHVIRQGFALLPPVIHARAVW